MNEQLSYIIHNDQKTLLKTTVFDEKGKVISLMHHLAEPPYEKRSTYNEHDDLIEEVEIQEGMEVSKFTFEYDDQQRLISEKQYISDYLYSHVKTTYTEKGFERITTENEEEVEKLVRTEFKGLGEYQNDFFTNGEFMQSQLRHWDEGRQSYITRILDDVDQLIQTNTERFTSDKKIMEFLEESGSGDLISRTTYEYEDRIILITTVDYRTAYPLTKAKRVFDEKDRCILYERINDKGGLLEYRQYEFDDEDRLVKEVNRLVGDFDDEHGVPLNNYEVVHEYTD